MSPSNEDEKDRSPERRDLPMFVVRTLNHRTPLTHPSDTHRAPKTGLFKRFAGIVRTGNALKPKKPEAHHDTAAAAARRAHALAQRGLLPHSRRYSAYLDAAEARAVWEEPRSEGQDGLSAAEIVRREWESRQHEGGGNPDHAMHHPPELKPAQIALPPSAPVSPGVPPSPCSTRSKKASPALPPLDIGSRPKAADTQAREALSAWRFPTTPITPESGATEQLQQQHDEQPAQSLSRPLADDSTPSTPSSPLLTPSARSLPSGTLSRSVSRSGPRSPSVGPPPTAPPRVPLPPTPAPTSPRLVPLPPSPTASAFVNTPMPPSTENELGHPFATQRQAKGRISDVVLSITGEVKSNWPPDASQPTGYGVASQGAIESLKDSVGGQQGYDTHGSAKSPPSLDSSRIERPPPPSPTLVFSPPPAAPATLRPLPVLPVALPHSLYLHNPQPLRPAARSMPSLVHTKSARPDTARTARTDSMSSHSSSWASAFDPVLPPVPKASSIKQVRTCSPAVTPGLAVHQPGRSQAVVESPVDIAFGERLHTDLGSLSVEGADSVRAECAGDNGEHASDCQDNEHEEGLRMTTLPPLPPGAAAPTIPTAVYSKSRLPPLPTLEASPFREIPPRRKEPRKSLGIFGRRKTSVPVPPPILIEDVSRKPSLGNLRKSVIASLAPGTARTRPAPPVPPPPTPPPATTYLSSHTAVKQVLSTPARSGIPASRMPLSPTMHSHTSIVVEAGGIEDDESRRLSEMAYMI